MVILFNSYGDHSNRLFQNVRIETYCLEHKIEFKNTTMDDIRNYYESPSVMKKLKFQIFLKINIFKYILKKLNILKIITFIEDKPNINALLNARSKNYYVEGWYYEGNEVTKKHQDIMIKKYTLKKKFYEDDPLYIKICSLDKEIYSVVAVHIRRGDYKSWQNGIYYYEDDVYQRYINILEQKIIKKNKKPIFIIFSNEDTSFKESDNIWISKNSWYLDHFIMSKSDYIIGPPSTFSMWASYIGKTKFFHIKNAKQDIMLENFEYWL